MFGIRRARGTVHPTRPHASPRLSRAGRVGKEACRELLITPVEILGVRARRRRRLADARAFAQRILANDSAVLAACGPRTVIARVEITSTDVAVVTVSPPAQPPFAVVKLPMTARAVDGMLRESCA